MQSLSIIASDVEQPEEVERLDLIYNLVGTFRGSGPNTHTRSFTFPLMEKF